MSHLKAIAGPLDDKRHGPVMLAAAQFTDQANTQLLRLALDWLDVNLAQLQARLEMIDGLAHIPGQLTTVIAALLLQGGPVSDAVVENARWRGQGAWTASGVEQAQQFGVHRVEQALAIEHQRGVDIARGKPLEQRRTHAGVCHGRRAGLLAGLVGGHVPDRAGRAFLGAVVFLGSEFPFDLGEVQGDGFHRFAPRAATDADIGQHHIGEGVDDERHQLAAAFGGVTADGDLGFRDRFASAAVAVEARRGAVDELGQGELADVRLAGRAFRVADVVGDLHRDVVAVRHDFDLVLVALEQAVAFDVAAEVENDCIHRLELLKVIAIGTWVNAQCQSIKPNTEPDKPNTEPVELNTESDSRTLNLISQTPSLWN